MDVYMFQAALICDTCGTLYKQGTDKPAHVDESDEYSYDSDDWPKGPYPDGGGEADSPQHCDHCGVFLDNALTPDGEEYVLDAFLEYIERGQANINAMAEWSGAYPWIVDKIADHLDIDNLPDKEAARYERLESWK